MKINLKVNTFVLDIWDDECKKCIFYTVRWSDSEVTETDKFLLQYEKKPEYIDDLYKLMSLLITQIGDEYGAIDAFFTRHEQLATALPSKKNSVTRELDEITLNFPLRLYCLRITEQIVILFNGGIKDGNKSHQDSPELSMQFYEAQKFTKKILQALREGMIVIQGNQLLDFQGNKEITL